MSFLPVLFLVVLLALTACQPGTCNNSISGNSNVASCGGSGDDQDVSQTTPAPVVVEPVVVVPPEPGE